MPTKPKKPCGKPGCNKLTYSRFCEEHTKAARKAEDERRGTAAERGYDARWSRASARHKREHPFCSVCLKEGVLTPVEVTDHIIPHKGDPVLFWDEKNWDSKCKRHHDIKTATEDGAFGRPAKAKTMHD